jgi:hypothetical protein
MRHTYLDSQCWPVVGDVFLGSWLSAGPSRKPSLIRTSLGESVYSVEVPFRKFAMSYSVLLAFLACEDDVVATIRVHVPFSNGEIK